MGFNIKEISDKSVNVYITDELSKAEKNGLTRVIITKPHLLDYKPLLGQIFINHQYIGNNEMENPVKKVWKLIDGKPHTIRERRDGSFIQDEAGELILEVVEGDYLPKKNKFITEREVEQIIHKEGNGLWKVGQFLINDKGDYGRIKAFRVGEIVDDILTKERPIENPHHTPIYQDDVQIVVSFEKDKRIDPKAPEFDGEEVYSFGKKEFGMLRSKWNIIEDTDLIGYERKIVDAKELGTLEMFNEQLMIGTSPEEQLKADMGVNSTALMGTGNQEQLQLMHDKIYRKNQLSKAIQCSFVRVVTLKKEEFEFALAKEKEKMSLMKKELEYQITVFQKQMKKIQRLIITLEIYMGESEKVIQIAEGEKAGENETIALRQMMLYMDEEFGDPDDGGLDFSSIEKFDEWLVDSGNYERLIPEQKGVVILRPRRDSKDYADLRGKTDFWAAMERYERDSLDKKFYVLIRNGQNLYKIYTDNIKFGKRLFPLKSELQSLMDDVAKGQIKMNESERGDYSFKNAEEEVERANDKLFSYQRNFLLLQGIIMRTNIFTPIPTDFNFLDVNTHGKTVKFIYDEENNLSDGKLRFVDFKQKINQSIVKGSRIIIAGEYPIRQYSDRFNFDVTDRMLYTLNSPEQGIYNVKSRIVKNEKFKTEWMPESELNEIERKHELMKAKYAVVYSENSFRFTPKYNFPSDYYMKYERGSSYKETDKGRLVQVYILNEEGNKETVDASYEELYVSYSYKHEYTDKIINKTFIIKPSDSQILKYDALALEDIDYYLSNRMDRPNYLSMMPLFYELRDQLRLETEKEQGFVSLIKSELLKDYPSLGELNIESVIWDAVDWWKNKKAVVWKRPITKDDGKAFEMIMQEVKKTCKKLGKKGINTGTNYKESLLVWRISNFTFYAYGVTKKEFTEQVNQIKEKSFRMKRLSGFSKCLDQVRGVLKPRNVYEEEMFNQAKELKGIVNLKEY